jgi:hypothetical protein
MAGRAFAWATVMLVVCCFKAGPAQAQENLDAGKSPSQIFAGTCTACHKSPRGLLKTVAPGALQGFLRQHYTTSPEMAGVLASYLVSNGASDARYMGSQPKGGKEAAKDAKSDAKPDDTQPSFVEQLGRRLRSGRTAPEPADAREASPAPEGTASRDEPSRRMRRGGKHTARAAADAKPDGDSASPAAEAAAERGADGHKSRHKRKYGKRGKSDVDEQAKPDAATDESATPKSEREKTEQARPATDDRAEPASADLPKESQSPVLRAEPAPSVTSAPVTTQSISGSTGDSNGGAATAPAAAAPAVQPAGATEPAPSH